MLCAQGRCGVRVSDSGMEFGDAGDLKMAVGTWRWLSAERSAAGPGATGPSRPRRRLKRPGGAATASDCATSMLQAGVPGPDRDERRNKRTRTNLQVVDNDHPVVEDRALKEAGSGALETIGDAADEAVDARAPAAATLETVRLVIEDRTPRNLIPHEEPKRDRHCQH
eukprot:3935748-Rhodomonas_salina.1